MSNYFMKYVSKHKLEKLGFHKVNLDDIWVYKFPLYKWGNTPTILGKITLFEDDGSCHFDVMSSNGECYPPFYKNTYGNFETMLNIINTGIANKCKQFGIREKKENGKKDRRKHNDNRRMSKM